MTWYDWTGRKYSGRVNTRRTPDLGLVKVGEIMRSGSVYTTRRTYHSTGRQLVDIMAYVEDSAQEISNPGAADPLRLD